MKKVFLAIALMFCFINVYSADTLHLKVSIEGLHGNPTADTLVTTDTIKVILKSDGFPYADIDTAKGVLNHQGNVNLLFNRTLNNVNYWIVVRHRNSLETWSFEPKKFTSHSLTFDFTDDSSKAYNDNQVYTKGMYSIYSGDINQDGLIDLTDVTLINNDKNIFVTGYVLTDLTNDLVTDNVDLSIAYNNMSVYVEIQRPESNISFVKYSNPIMQHNDSNFLVQPYFPVFKRSDDSLEMIYQRRDTGRASIKTTSIDGINWSNRIIINNTASIPAEFMIRLNATNWIGIQDLPGYNGNYLLRNTRSFDAGLTWSLSDTIYAGCKGCVIKSYAGEDASAVYNNITKKYYLYFRNLGIEFEGRKFIALSKSTDSLWATFEDRIILMLFDSLNYFNPYSKVHHKAPYSVNVIKNNSDWWLFSNTIQNPQDTNIWKWNLSQAQKCSLRTDERDYAVDTYLFYSTNGETWTICNDSLPIVTSDDKRNIYSIPSIIGSNVYLYSFQGGSDHEGCDLGDSSHFAIYLYTISLTNLEAYKP